MTRLFMYGNEQGHLGGWSGTTGAVIASNAQARTGSYSMYAGNSGRYATFNMPASKAEVYFRVGIYITVFGSHDDACSFLRFLDSGAAAQITLRMNATTKVLELVRGNAGGTLLASGSTALLANTWYCVEGHYVIDNAAGVGQIKLNGVQEINFSGDTQQTGNANVQYVHLGSLQIGGAWDLRGYFDDFALNSTDGAINNAWIGQGGIYGVVPNGAGTYTEWTPSAGANWQCVDEVPPNDAVDYIESNVVDQRDTYSHTDALAAGVVSATCWWARAQVVPGGAGNIARFLRIAGADYQGGDLGLTAGSWLYFSDLMELSPATAAAWTIAEINAMEIGVRCR